ncbi:TlpA family protein disulfide reductase [Sphingobacterium shayense]|uniref:TlpA family protein disulfide reductase n=1 Tax=Sphingobacterium shayense TaxID=626343 RepID=UPI00155648D2|nr:TlpA disulfide reductase family protein [Sphingobacterium shayense]NQD69826.1 TlpA family protein disulfide reductase [Sphingobacterium shayense]
MKRIDLILLLLCSISTSIYGQKISDSLLTLGDQAPPLRVKEWIKGTPIKHFEKNHIYIIEFWATWCAPCRAEMPHLSSIQKKFKDKITVIGVDIYEEENTSLEKIRSFVDSMGDKMDYHVAIDDSTHMVEDWIVASGEKNGGIPESYVVDNKGRLAWYGDPWALDTVLQKIIDDNWDVEQELAYRKVRKHFEQLTTQASDTIREFRVNNEILYYPVEIADSTLKIIKRLVSSEPLLKNSAPIQFYTLESLLVLNQEKAYLYGQEILSNKTEEPGYLDIIGALEWYEKKGYIIPKLYRLGAEAYQVKVNDYIYPDIIDLPYLYSNMAKWYWEANDKARAIESQRQSIDILKSKKSYKSSELKKYELLLQKYNETTLGVVK